MKRWGRTLLLITTVLSVCGFATSVVAETIKISSFSDLRKIGTTAEFPIDGEYELTTDIDATSSHTQAFLPIALNGSFDGKNHTISGLYIKLGEGHDDVGLFGVVGNAEIRNVLLVADSIIGGLNVGALVGRAINTTIENCHVKSGYISGKSGIGGVAGLISGTIKNCSSAGICYATGYSGVWVGGSAGSLVGNAENAVIANCYATGDVASEGKNVGGLIGYSINSNIQQCYSTGNVTGQDDVGGFMGHVNERNVISDCYSIGDAKVRTGLCGGFMVSWSQNNTIRNCYSVGSISNRCVGFSDYYDSNFSNCFWDTQTSGQLQTESNNAIGKNTDEMKKQATYIGWDFDLIWAIDEGISYPSLRNVKGNSVFELIYAAGIGGRLVGTISQLVSAGSDGTTVAALPNAGYTFTNWSDGVTTSDRTDRNVTSDITVSAIFTPTDPRVLTYRADAGGTISGQANQTISVGGIGSAVEAVPDAGYIFVKWSDNVTTAARTDKNVQSNITVTATFTRIYTLRYTAGAGGQIDGSATQTVSPGTNGSTVVAVADGGYEFVSWSDGLTTAVRTDENVVNDIAVTANFAPAEYTLNYRLGIGGKTFAGNPQQTILPGGNGQEIYAVAEAGYTFAMWSDGSTDNPRIDTNVRGNLTVTAYFADPDGNVSINLNNRVIPQSNTSVVAVVVPTPALIAEFTAGPNPAVKSSGTVNFFRYGSRIKSANLSIYDASGNAVKKLTIRDNAAVGKRTVGSWDLTDTRGRRVSEGTYLVKGVLKTSNGKRETVSAVVGVR